MLVEVNPYIAILAGTDNPTHPLYVEAAKDVNTNNRTGVAKMRNFLTSIEELANSDKVKDKRISDSKGNIREFSGYKNINTVLSGGNHNDI